MIKGGLLISLSGTDGVGKSTQSKFLEHNLAKSGYDVLLTREPGGVDSLPEIRELIITKDIDPITEILLFAADRTEHVKQVIKPALDGNRIVVTDRYTDDSMAYQGCGRFYGKPDMMDFIYIVNRKATSGLIPHITFLLDMDPEQAAGRVMDKDRFERDMGLQNRIRRGYLEMARWEPYRFITIDARKYQEAIAGEILERVEVLIDGKTKKSN